MSANWFGNDSQGYFGAFFGPNAPAEGNFVVESITVSDSVSASVSYVVSQSDALSLSDSAGDTSHISAALSESLFVLDSCSSVVLFLGAVTEVLSALSTETDQMDFYAGLSESISTNDSFSASRGLSASISEFGLSAQDSQNGLSSDTSVSESITISDLSDSVLVPNPTPPNPQPSETTMPPGAAGATIDRSRARPLRYNYDGELKIKLSEDGEIFTGAARSVCGGREVVQGRRIRPVSFFVGLPASSKASAASRCLGVAERRSSVKNTAKTGFSAHGNITRFGQSISKTKGISSARGISSVFAGSRSKSRTFSYGASGGVTSFGAISKGAAKCYAMAGGRHTVEFTEEQMELILAVAKQEFFS